MHREALVGAHCYPAQHPSNTSKMQKRCDNSDTEGASCVLKIAVHSSNFSQPYGESLVCSRQVNIFIKCGLARVL